MGSCHAWLATGGESRHPDHVVQECGAGLVPVRRDAEMLAFAMPQLLRDGMVDEGLDGKGGLILIRMPGARSGWEAEVDPIDWTARSDF